MEDQLSLLPRSHQEFRERAYWDEFFVKRQEKAFEWYGDFAVLKRLLYAALDIDMDFPQKLQKQMKATLRILVVGCGNSELSKQLVDDGFVQVVSIDFSEQVIQEMQTKHPALDWRVMDMTSLRFADESFDVVLDKGALDALMASNETQILQEATKMFQEIARVLTPSRGKYLCVTMAQDFILEHLLGFFMVPPQDATDACSWRSMVQEIPRDLRKPFAPFLVAFSKVSDPQVRFNKKAFASEDATERKQWLVHEMQAVQWFTMTQQVLKEIKVGRQEVIELLDNTASSSTPRYTLRLVDVQMNGPNGSCGVFLIPQGKEHEWMFATQEGAAELASGAGFSRLILVAMGRGHTFTDTKQIQHELNAKILELAPWQMAKHEQIPYLTIPQGLGNRNIIHKGESALSGEFFIEEVVEDGQRFRRLVFLSNTNVIQSEIRLVSGSNHKSPALATTSGDSMSSKKKSNKKKKKKQAPKPSNTESTTTSSTNQVVDESYLAFDYHKAMVAILFAAQAAQSTNPSRHDSLLVGLGGGCLAKYIQDHFTNVHMNVCELDLSIVDIAQQFFGFETSAQTRVEVMDGIELVANQAQKNPEGSYDSIVIDVDAKESNNQGMSCPPVAFVEEKFLENVVTCLKPGGLLLVNVSCRSNELYQTIISKLKSAFATDSVLALAPSDQDVNRVVMVQKASSSAAKTTLLDIDLLKNKSKNPQSAQGILKHAKQLDDELLELLDELCIAK